MMREMPFAELADLSQAPANGWSIGSFGAIGEFVREADEPVHVLRSLDRIELLTRKGAMRLARTSLACVAWESLSSDGTGWGHNLALCAPSAGAERGVITALGQDHDAVRPQDRHDWLFDLGVSRGLVRMCVRSAAPALKIVLDGAEGMDFLSSAGLVAAVMEGQPNRVLLSPAGRIEVFQPIPAAHDLSPIGPHTHLLPRLIASGRLHSANDPIPDGWQAVLNLHPPRPLVGERHQRHLDPACDRSFCGLLERYGDSREASLATSLVAQVAAGSNPNSFLWPHDRRDRVKARLVLRQLTAAGDGRARPWRAIYDRARAPRSR